MRSASPGTKVRGYASDPEKQDATAEGGVLEANGRAGPGACGYLASMPWSLVITCGASGSTAVWKL